MADTLTARLIPLSIVTGYGVAGLRPDDLHRPILEKPVDAESIARVVKRWRPD